MKRFQLSLPPFQCPSPTARRGPDTENDIVSIFVLKSRFQSIEGLWPHSHNVIVFDPRSLPCPLLALFKIMRWITFSSLPQSHSACFLYFCVLILACFSDTEEKLPVVLSFATLTSPSADSWWNPRTAFFRWSSSVLLIKSAKCCLFIRSEGTNQVFNILQHEWLGLVLMWIKMTKLPMMTRSGEEKSISDFKALCRYSSCKSLELNARVNQHCNIQTNIFWIKVPHRNQRLFCLY